MSRFAQEASDLSVQLVSIGLIGSTSGTIVSLDHFCSVRLLSLTPTAVTIIAAFGTGTNGCAPMTFIEPEELFG